MPGHRFQKGNKAAVGNKGGGRPKEKNRKEYLNILHDALTPEKWKKIINQAVKDATDQDDAWSRAKAREFLGKAVLPQKIELEWTDELPVRIVGVEGYKGWKEKK